MRNLDTAVQDLAVALEELSAKVELQRLKITEDDERSVEKRRHANEIKGKISAASRNLASVIDDLKAMQDQEDED